MIFGIKSSGYHTHSIQHPNEQNFKEYICLYNLVPHCETENIPDVQTADVSVSSLIN